MNYSTSEKDTGMKWVDGRKIYRKTISMGGGSNTHKETSHHISNLRRVVKFEGQAWDGDVSIPIPFTATNDAKASVQMFVSSTKIVLDCGYDRSNLSEIYVTLYYTKTTG